MLYKNIRKIKKELEPRKDFVKQTKEEFLRSFRETYHVRPAFVWSAYVLKTSVVIVAVLAIFVSTSVYADQTNVPVTSPLYELKKVGESIRVAFAPKEKVEEIYEELALRRTEELHDERVHTLSEDMHGKLAMDTNKALKKTLESVSEKVKTQVENEPMVRKQKEETKESEPNNEPDKKEKNREEAGEGMTMSLRSSLIAETPEVQTFISETASSSTSSVPQETPVQESPVIEEKTKNEKKDIEEEHARARCGIVEGIMEDVSIWTSVKDEELEQLFKEKCQGE